MIPIKKKGNNSSRNLGSVAIHIRLPFPLFTAKLWETQSNTTASVLRAKKLARYMSQFSNLVIDVWQGEECKGRFCRGEQISIDDVVRLIGKSNGRAPDEAE